MYLQLPSLLYSLPTLSFSIASVIGFTPATGFFLVGCKMYGSQFSQFDEMVFSVQPLWKVVTHLIMHVLFYATLRLVFQLILPRFIFSGVALFISAHSTGNQLVSMFTLRVSNLSLWNHWKV
jgi:hypothetical protein